MMHGQKNIKTGQYVWHFTKFSGSLFSTNSYTV